MNARVKEPLILIDDQKKTFKVARNNFIDSEVLQAERDRIFGNCWLYVGHGSELNKPGDFMMREVGGRSILFAKDREGVVRAMYNTCPHRGAQVCRERSGNAKSFQCFYHGWVFGLDGKLRSQPGEEAYPEGFKDDPSSSLSVVKRMESYRDLYFICFDDDAVSLDTYLGNAKEYLDLICDQAEDGLEIVRGAQEYAINANWKLLTENSIDGYHAASTHATYMDYLKSTDGGLTSVALTGYGRDLGNGHAVIEYAAPWGRPVAQWIPMWGETGKKEIGEILARLEARHGKERAERIAYKNRNLHIFPNLIINDIMALTVRTYFPKSESEMQVNAWAAAPRGESGWARKFRLFNFLEFLGPGGFATPDDVEALEHCQRGYLNSREVRWNDISKGMSQATPAMTDEEQMRAFWKQWNARMTGMQAGA
ncbi:Rieske 2Fe-2S domain-containing protein [Bradyrhizobium manausense]|jgi:p-cumate 2,3-dioxygenase alpha subunit|uniref:aromatic ring-hydroxylating oxygenase subunit alpha n=1 Tax=Bradyrhizobium manausense TaxID=989370 RepID=UPI001BACD398|nr:aromatic ring-hydroxylating dioxygenase subunit alpha [Bradyrhizobium manausense]MBR1087716.1 Rieske 2Fe-2S domain-containing protein [Bradyrhizobium manausense]